MILLEGNFIKVDISEKDFNDAEVIDLKNKILFKGRLVEARCENHTSFGTIESKYTKVILEDYTAEPLPEGHQAKKTIKKAIEKIYEDNDDMMYMNDDENVDIIYNELKKAGCLE